MTDTPLKQFHYRRCLHNDKGVLRRYLQKAIGFSRAQVPRSIREFRDDGAIKDRRRAPVVPFQRRYTADDIRLLAELAPCMAPSPAPHHRQAVRACFQCAWS